MLKNGDWAIIYAGLEKIENEKIEEMNKEKDEDEKYWIKANIEAIKRVKDKVMWELEKGL